MTGNSDQTDGSGTADGSGNASAGAGRDRLSRWRLVLGGQDADGISTEDGVPVQLSDDDVRRDQALEELYGGGSGQRGGLGVVESTRGPLARGYPRVLSLLSGPSDAV